MIPKRPLGTLRALFFIGILALALTNVATAQDGTHRIRNFDATLSVRSDRSLDVTEDLTLHLTGASNEFVRDLSLRDDGAPNGSNKLNVEILAVTDEDGQPLRTEETSADYGWTRRVRIWIPGGGNGDRHIAIRYRLANAIHFVNGANKPDALDEVRWNLIGNADMPVDSMHARVILPTGARAVRTAVYSGPNSSPVTDATIRKDVDLTVGSPRVGVFLVAAADTVGRLSPRVPRLG